MSKLNNSFYFLSPVEVVKVTKENMEEVAEWCGGKIHKVESRRVKGRMDPYVWVPTPKGSAISWAFAGMFITKRLVTTEKGDLKATYAVFRRDYFVKNYFTEVAHAVDATWERELREKKRERANAPTTVVVHVEKSDEIVAQIEEIKDNIKAIADDMGIDLEEVVEKVTEITEPLDLTGTDGIALSPVEQRQLITEHHTEAETRAAGDPHRA